MILALKNILNRFFRLGNPPFSHLCGQIFKRLNHSHIGGAAHKQIQTWHDMKMVAKISWSSQAINARKGGNVDGVGYVGHDGFLTMEVPQEWNILRQTNATT